jgi:hypothetical protein
MIFNSISALLLMNGASFLFNAAPIALAFAPSSSLQHGSLLTNQLASPTQALVLNASIRKEDAENNNNNKDEYESHPQCNQSRRELFKILPSAAAALTATMFGGVATADAYAPAPKKNAFIGPLNDLVGKWEGNQGFVLISVPAPGSIPSNTRGDFKLLKFPYRETIEIEALDDGVGNKGGSIDQLNGVCTYSKTVWATDKFPNDPDKQTVIHKEDGMFFYLDPIATNPDQKPVSLEDKAPFSIGRSAVIPHGNTAMIFGDVTKCEGPPTIPNISTAPFTTPETQIPFGYFEGQANGFQDKPNTVLQDALKNGPAVANTVQFSMSSKNGTGGVLNTNFITKRADTREFKVDMWVEDLGNNQKQLQYAETASIFFHFNQNVEINWPHVMVNTLTKVDEKDSDGRRGSRSRR